MLPKLLHPFLIALAIGMPAHAQLAPPQREDIPAVQRQKITEPDERELQTHGHYRNRRGEEVHAPAKSTSDKAPDGASAHCRDGTYSFSRSRRGTCSHHGGVAAWL